MAIPTGQVLRGGKHRYIGHREQSAVDLEGDKMRKEGRNNAEGEGGGEVGLTSSGTLKGGRERSSVSRTTNRRFSKRALLIMMHPRALLKVERVRLVNPRDRTTGKALRRLT